MASPHFTHIDSLGRSLPLFRLQQCYCYHCLLILPPHRRRPYARHARARAPGADVDAGELQRMLDCVFKKCEYYGLKVSRIKTKLLLINPAPRCQRHR